MAMESKQRRLEETVEKEKFDGGKTEERTRKRERERELMMESNTKETDDEGRARERDGGSIEVAAEQIAARMEREGRTVERRDRRKTDGRSGERRLKRERNERTGGCKTAEAHATE